MKPAPTSLVLQANTYNIITIRLAISQAGVKPAPIGLVLRGNMARYNHLLLSLALTALLFGHCSVELDGLFAGIHQRMAVPNGAIQTLSLLGGRGYAIIYHSALTLDEKNHLTITLVLMQADRRAYGQEGVD